VGRLSASYQEATAHSAVAKQRSDIGGLASNERSAQQQAYACQPENTCEPESGVGSRGITEVRCEHKNERG